MNNMTFTQGAKVAGYFILFYMLLDIVGFCLWSTSGQPEPDGYFVGSITTHLIKSL